MKRPVAVALATPMMKRPAVAVGQAVTASKKPWVMQAAGPGLNAISVMQTGSLHEVFGGLSFPELGRCCSVCLPWRSEAELAMAARTKDDLAYVRKREHRFVKRLILLLKEHQIHLRELALGNEIIISESRHWERGFSKYIVESAQTLLAEASGVDMQKCRDFDWEADLQQNRLVRSSPENENVDPPGDREPEWAVYAKVASNRRVKRKARRQNVVEVLKDEIQTFITRDRAFVKLVQKLTDHGRDMVWYGRSGIDMHVVARAPRARIRKRRKEHVARYERAATRADPQESDEIFGSFCAAHALGNLLPHYLGNGNKFLASEHWTWWLPIEAAVAEAEDEFPFLDT